MSQSSMIHIFANISALLTIAYLKHEINKMEIFYRQVCRQNVLLIQQLELIVPQLKKENYAIPLSLVSVSTQTMQSDEKEIEREIEKEEHDDIIHVNDKDIPIPSSSSSYYEKITSRLFFN